jgi:Uma2 family endonuclease
MSDMAIDLQIRPITVDEYQRMADAGIIDVDERIELLDGMLVRMPPIGWTHMFAHERIVRYLVDRLGSAALIAGQASLPLTATDEPQPDITLFRPGTDRKPKSSWTHADLLGLFELSDSTLRRDSGPKRKAYARGGVAELVIVDLHGARLLRHREPDGADYRTVDELFAGDRFALEALPDISLDVSAFLENS